MKRRNNLRVRRLVREAINRPDSAIIRASARVEEVDALALAVAVALPILATKEAQSCRLSMRYRERRGRKRRMTLVRLYQKA